MNAIARGITLDDKYARLAGDVYLTGIQALVRLLLDRARRDSQEGVRTGGFVSGYRGSPVAGLDQQLQAAAKHLKVHDIVFQPGVNEELAATAVWGSQKLGTTAPTRFAGAFGMWYGKGPGVDRTGDVFKHATQTGTSRYGGVVAVAGDDHRAKSSTLAHQSEYAFVDAEMPVLNPADLQDILDLGLHGYELSRFCGLWVGLIALADTMDSSGIVRVDPQRLTLLRPEEADPRRTHELNRVATLKGRTELELLLREVRLPAALAYARANRLDRVGFGAARPRIGIVAAGKAFRDLMQAFAILGIDQAFAEQHGLGVWRVAMSWPLEPEGLGAFAANAERLLVVEHKRALIEPQIKDRLYHWPADRRPQIFGKKTPDGAPLLPDTADLGLEAIARALTAFLPDEARPPRIDPTLARIEESRAYAARNAADAARSPYFCAGCPHNTSTKIPDGAMASAGIGCHVLTEIAGRTHEGTSAMGGEGVMWVGAHPFSEGDHVFANLGDGTYFHSGILAIRQAIAADAPITYKILYNDAVAMTGGQHVDGTLTVPQLTRQLHAEGVKRLALVSETPEHYVGVRDLAPGVKVEHRDELPRIQKEFAKTSGVSVIVYDQTCATEKRRRRKRGLMPQADRRLFINDRVCEACGDCSVQSNCIAVEPLETPFGTKRTINQSNCNQDYSCANGFCPSFIQLEEGVVAKTSRSADVAPLAARIAPPSPARPAETLNILLTGIGGMGVTTTAAIVAMAAHLDGLNVLTLDMTGLAQKGGPVTSHVRLGPAGRPIEGPGVPVASVDVLLAGDLLTAAQADALALMAGERTCAIGNRRVAPTAEFVLHQRQSFEAARLARTVRQASRSYSEADFTRAAVDLIGDALFANMIMVGFAHQSGLVPISLGALEQAIRLNGTAVEANLAALQAGRILAVDPAALGLGDDEPEVTTFEERLAFLARDLEAYQDADYARRYMEFVARVRATDERVAPLGGLALTRAVAENLYRLMAYKDEYEVARLWSDPAFMETLKTRFSSWKRLSVSLAPPLLARKDKATGRPKKTAFGPWIFTAFRILHRLRGLRGTRFDPFGWTAERRMERRLIEEYRADVEALLVGLSKDRYEAALELTRLPDMIRGYGFIKDRNVARFRSRRETLLHRWREAPLLQAAE